MDDKFLPFALPDIGEIEIESVADSMRSGWLTTGPKAKLFEEQFAEYVGAKYALAVNSCTAGLHLALDALGIGPGDKVLTTVYTFTATAEVIRYMGADPVFVDIDPVTLNLDIQAVEDALKSHPEIKAMIPVHIAGLACDMSALVKLSEKYGALIVEDAAHALPCTAGGKKIGSISPMTVFSFYVTKTIVTGEGGMVTTDDPDYAKRIKTMRLHGISRDVFDRYTSDKPSWYYEVVAPGFKYNMPDIAAAIGIGQLARCDGFQVRRQEIAHRYLEAFADLPLRLPALPSEGDVHSWHLFIARLAESFGGITRDKFIERMVTEGIGVSVHFIPLHLQPYWRDAYALTPEQFPVAHAEYQRAFSLPIYTKMTDDDVSRVISVVRNIIGAG